MFSIILVLLLEQHAIFFAYISSLIVHNRTGNNLLRLVQVIWNVVLHWDKINNQSHDIVVALISEVELGFHRHKAGHQLQCSQIIAFVHFFI
jgi:endonuclease III